MLIILRQKTSQNLIVKIVTLNAVKNNFLKHLITDNLKT